MSKQKIVVKVTMETEKKTRKAMTVAVSVAGVESVTFMGSDKDQIAVTGEGIDSVELTTLLRKKVGYTELVSVGSVEEKKPAKPTNQKEVKEIPMRFEYVYPQHYYGHSVPLQVCHEVPSNTCSIL